MMTVALRYEPGTKGVCPLKQDILPSPVILQIGTLKSKSGDNFSPEFIIEVKFGGTPKFSQLLYAEPAN